MSLEVATYISQLINTNPLSSDQVSQGDDHLRLIKAVLLSSFPNISGAMTATHTVLNGLDARVTTVEGWASAANVWTGSNTFRLSDDGALEGPTFNLDRLSTTPANSDLLAALNWTGRDSGGNTTRFASVFATIIDVTNGSEDGRLSITTVKAGTEVVAGYFEQGLVLGTPTGLDKGSGTINATALYDDNVQLLPITTTNVQGAYSSELGALLWHSLNDGAGSGLDADLLDGLQGSAFIQTTGAQAVKAWVFYNGAITGSHNVTSVTPHGSGHYTINFTSALGSANYAVIGSGEAIDGTANTDVAYRLGDTKSTTAVSIRVKRLDAGTNSAFHVMIV